MSKGENTEINTNDGDTFVQLVGVVIWWWIRLAWRHAMYCERKNSPRERLDLECTRKWVGGVITRTRRRLGSTVKSSNSNWLPIWSQPQAFYNICHITSTWGLNDVNNSFGVKQKEKILRGVNRRFIDINYAARQADTNYRLRMGNYRRRGDFKRSYLPKTVLSEWTLIQHVSVLSDRIETTQLRQTEFGPDCKPPTDSPVSLTIYNFWRYRIAEQTDEYQSHGLTATVNIR